MKTISIYKDKRNIIFFILLSGLFLLRFPLVILTQFDIIVNYFETGIYIYRVITYILVATLIFLKYDSLADYNITFYSIIILIISPVAELMSTYTLTRVYLPAVWEEKNIPLLSSIFIKIAISICLSLLLYFKRGGLLKKNIKKVILWLLTALIVGIILGVVSGIFTSFQSVSNPDPPSVLYLLCSFFMQLSTAAVSEEPFFRGFLWGFLKSLNLRTIWVLLIQAALFWLGHIYYFGKYNYSFFIVVPLGGIVLGLLVWRSKSIGTSMIAHGLINSIADTVAHFTW